MLPQWIIEKKRDGHKLTKEEISFFIKGFTDGSIPEYQMSALAMAIYFKGMAPDELAVLTDCMMHSGDVMDLSSISQVKADKHSTGGVGDKVSLILAPLVACCGLTVPMISGRGLGITGGTLDKLESIPGYHTRLPPPTFISFLQKCGCSIIGQSEQLAPADKKLYALRDVTGTVPSIPLISASIMSKKLAEGADVLVLDVKCGRAAFMKTRQQARELAKTMIAIGRKMGRKMSALVTDMDEPLGRAVGNSLEIIETIECLKGKGPTDLMEVTMVLCVEMLLLGRSAKNEKEALAMLQSRIDSGDALRKFAQMVEFQGGNGEIINDYSILQSAPIKHPITALKSGYIADVDAEKIGKACIVLGAGRKTVTDKIDHTAGICDIVKSGDKIQNGHLLMTIHAPDNTRLEEALSILEGAVSIKTSKPKPRVLIYEKIR